MHTPLLNAMQKAKGCTNFIIYFDIETLTYNKINGRKKPSLYKNVVYSVCVGFWNEETKNIDLDLFPSFLEFFETFFQYQKRKDTINPSKTSIILIAHNTNKYDNHYLLHDLEYNYNIERKNLFLNNATDNNNAHRKKEFKKSENIIFEKRVKSSINLELSFTLNNTKFDVIDNWTKTNTSIATLGKKLLKQNFVTESQLKTSYVYNEFDLDEDMTEQQAYDYALKVFKSLSKKHITYIENDVIILGKSHIHFSDIFPKFDYSKITFTKNILETYLTNQLSSFQLLNKIGQEQINYTDFTFDNQNFYDYIKSHYRGGLNFYNDEYVNKIIYDKCFSIDINSSYPYVMDNDYIPTFVNNFDEFEYEKNIPINISNEKIFTLYRVSKTTFNIEILSQIKSKILKQILVKYYHSDNEFVNINSNTLRLLKELKGIEIKELFVKSYVSFRCKKFGARDVLEKNYLIKTKGKSKTKIIMDNPYQYEITDIPNDDIYTDEEINISKVIMNGLYGIPALRSHFNIFRFDENDQSELINTINGYKNKERNLIFSTYVTSKAFFNLLQPLKYLTDKEIDKNFLYADTDSLYMKQAIYHKLSKSLFDPIILGKWDIETFDLKAFFILNHKKYAYQYPNGKINIKCGGVNLDSFNKNMSFERFIETQFCEGAKITNTKSIYTKMKTIAIYESVTELKKGGKYDTKFNGVNDEKRKLLKEIIKKEIDYQNINDYLYIESDLGSFSINDLYPVKHEIKEKTNLNILQNIHFQVEKHLFN